MANGKTAETGVVGNEGVVRLEGLFWLRRSPISEIVQVAGTTKSFTCSEAAESIPGPSCFDLGGRRYQPHASFSDDGLQPPTRSRRAPGGLAPYDAGSRSRGLPMSHDFVGDAGHGPQQRDRRRGGFAETENHSIHEGLGKGTESQGSRGTFVRVLRSHPRIQRRELIR